tara:strand:- start:206 stop:547 length:342 start_codon:yes stop_codon:yes gene_type:complete
MSEYYHFDVYQYKSQETAIYPDKGDNLYYPALGLAGEAGEVCEKIKKIMRDKMGVVTKEDAVELSKELGDVLWYISALASELGVSLSTIVEDNLEKLKSRQERGELQGSGDNR